MSEVLEKQVKYSSANIAVSTTDEVGLMGSGDVPVGVQTCLVHIRAWCQMTSGTGTTGITARLRRGEAGNNVVVGEANGVTLAATAGGNEQVVVEAVERRENVGSVSYDFSVQQAGATGNGTFLQGLIEVEILTG